MTFCVRLAEPAIDDLIELRRWIAHEADVEIADAYIRRLAQKFLALDSFPERGSPRPEIGPGMRSIPFERRRIIFYRIVGDDVWIERILAAGRDLERLLLS